jgi:rod shape-determining protein MreC
LSWKKDKPTIVLVALSLLLAVSLLLRQTGQMGPIYDALGGVVLPVQYASSKVSTVIAQRFAALANLRELEAQKRELEETVGELMLRTVELEEAKIELEALREQLEFKEANPEYDMLAAEVVGYDPTNLVRVLLIDRGVEDGIEPGMPVITSRGLVGRILEANRRWSKVLLIIDGSSSVNSMIQRSRATGVVQGRVGQGLALRYVPQGEEIQDGDMVVTSGLGGNLPKNLVIGQVSKVRQNDVEMFQEAEIRSAVDFYRLELVMVIRDFVPINLEAGD